MTFLYKYRYILREIGALMLRLPCQVREYQVGVSQSRCYLCALVNSLVGQSSGTRDDSDATSLMNVTGHDSDFALINNK